VHYLDNEVLDIIDARCNHEVWLFLFISQILTVLNAKIIYERHLAWCTERTKRDMLSAHS